jgi:prepilin-type N-terminal cleavage/methylation domain-containing protein
VPSNLTGSCKAMNKRGFTIVELLIVIVVIGILATISLVAFNGIQAKGRDSIRKSDLATIAKALNSHNIDKGDYIETASGCGMQSNGNGWFNASGSGFGAQYGDSLSSCLRTAGYIQRDIIDPTGGLTSTPATGFTYMKYHCGSGSTKQVYVYAKSESIPQNATATDGTCDSTLDTNYGMNYYLRVN